MNELEANSVGMACARLQSITCELLGSGKWKAASLTHNAAGHLLVQLGESAGFIRRFSPREWIWKRLGI